MIQVISKRQLRWGSIRIESHTANRINVVMCHVALRIFDLEKRNGALHVFKADEPDCMYHSNIQATN